MHTMPRRHRPALAMLTAALTAAGALTMVTPMAAHAETRTVAVAKDPATDVHLSKHKGLTEAQKRSIDMRRVTLKRVGNQARFVIAIRDLQRTRAFDQIFSVTWVEQTRPASDRRFGQVSFSSKKQYAEAFYTDANYDSLKTCQAPISRRAQREEVVVTVPRACVPKGQLKIRVSSATGHYGTDEPASSQDSVRFSGKPVVR